MNDTSIFRHGLQFNYQACISPGAGAGGRAAGAGGGGGTVIGRGEGGGNAAAVGTGDGGGEDAAVGTGGGKDPARRTIASKGMYSSQDSTAVGLQADFMAHPKGSSSSLRAGPAASATR